MFFKKKRALDENTIHLSKAEKDLNSRVSKGLELSANEKERAITIRKKFPATIPVVVTRYIKETSLPNLKQSKYIVPDELSMAQFQMFIRNRIGIHPTKALFFLINERSMVSLSITMAEAYKEFSQQDGYLKITYASQETFGCSC